MKLRAKKVYQTKTRNVRMIALVSAVMAAAWLLASPADNLAAGPSKEDIRNSYIATSDLPIVVTAMTRSNFEPCGCGGVNQGGLSRRATLIDEFRTLKSDILLLDAGDMVSGKSSPKLEYMAQGYSILNYDAILIGFGELKAGLQNVLEAGKKHNLPLVLSNVKFKEHDTSPSVPEVVTLTRNEKKIAVVGLVSASQFESLSGRYKAGLVVENPLIAVQRLTKELKDTNDIIVVISYMPDKEFAPLRASTSDVSLWINNPGKTPKPRMKKSKNGKPVLRKAKNKQNEGPSDFLAVKDPLSFGSWVNDRKLGLACLKTTDDKIEVSHSEWVGIEQEVEEKAELLELFDVYKFASRQANIPRLMTKGGRERQKNFHYSKAEDCRECHEKQYDFWANTKHANAFDSLTKDNGADNPNCWTCHVTGATDKTGFVNPEKTPELMNVGCQMCHRVDTKWHPEEKAGRPRIFNITMSWHCVRCHVPRRSPRFRSKFRKIVKRVSCPKMERPPSTQATAATSK